MSVLFLLAHYFWVIRAVLQAALLRAMLGRNFHKQFPLFVLYVTWALLKALILIGMNYAPFITGNEYYYAFMIGKAGGAALSFAVIYEISTYLLRHHTALSNLGTVFLRWSTVALLLLAISLAWFAPATGVGSRMSVFYVIERTVSMLQIGLLLALFAFSRYLGLSWRSYAFGIALGLGLFATVNLGTSAIRSQVEPIAPNLSTDVLSLVTEIGYACCLLVWIAYLMAPEQRPHASVETLPDHDLEAWNQELRRLLQQ